MVPFSSSTQSNRTSMPAARSFRRAMRANGRINVDYLETEDDERQCHDDRREAARVTECEQAGEHDDQHGHPRQRSL